MLLYGDFGFLRIKHGLIQPPSEGSTRPRVRAKSTWIPGVEIRVQAGSKLRRLRHSFAFRVQIGSKQKACNSCVFSERSL